MIAKEGWLLGKAAHLLNRCRRWISGFVFEAWKRPSCVGWRFWWSSLVRVEELGRGIEARSGSTFFMFGCKKRGDSCERRLAEERGSCTGVLSASREKNPLERIFVLLLLLCCADRECTLQVGVCS